MLRASGFLEFLGSVFSVVTDKIGISSELVPRILIKMFSSSAATGLVLDIFKEHGPDSLFGMTTSIMMRLYGNGVLYHVGLLYGDKVTKTRYTLLAQF